MDIYDLPHVVDAYNCVGTRRENILYQKRVFEFFVLAN